jgi:hypothetical protein
MPQIKATFDSAYPFVLTIDGQRIQMFATYIDAYREYVAAMHMYELNELNGLNQITEIAA